MKKDSIIIAAIGFICAIFIGCTTSVVSDEPINEVPESGTNILNIHIEKNGFTRAEGDDEAISTLHIALFKSGGDTPKLVAIHEAQKVTENDENNYTVTLPVSVSKPDFDMVIAYANLTETDVAEIKDKKKLATTSTLQNDGKLLMSTAVSLETNESSSAIRDFAGINEITDEMSVNITLDRVAAKVAVSQAEPLTLTDVSAKNLKGEDVTLSLDLSNWGIVNVDASSYLLRQLTTIPTPADWIYKNSETLHWAESIKYGSLATNNTLDKVKVEELSYTFSGEIYVHESTRSEEDLKNMDTRPSVVLLGKYTTGNKDMGTFLRMRSSGDDDIILTEDDYWEALASSQAIIKKSANEKVTATDLKAILELAPYADDEKSYSHIVVPKLKSSEVPSGYDFTNVDDVNAALASTIQPMEIYEGGKCIFIVPIEHKTSGNDKVNSLVRNHKYTVTIKSISGLGHGVSGNNMVITEAAPGDFTTTYKVNAGITVNGWHENTQEVVIPKD